MFGPDYEAKFGDSECLMSFKSKSSTLEGAWFLFLEQYTNPAFSSVQFSQLLCELGFFFLLSPNHFLHAFPADMEFIA